MIDNRCCNCLWWDNSHPRVALCPQLDWMQSPGICRKHKPGAVPLDRTTPIYVGVQPLMDADDFCGEFREDKE